MTLNADCGNAEALIGYLYDECDAAERVAMAAHLAVCARCATELGALRQTRTEMAAWTPPSTQLGFRIVTDVARPELVPAPTAASVAVANVGANVGKNVGKETVPNNVVRPARWWAQPLPAWAQAAAAAVIFAVGLGLGAIRGTAPSVAGNSASTQDLAAVEQRLRTEMKAEMQAGIQQLRPVAGTSAATTPVTVPQAVSHQVEGGSGLTLQQVRALIDDSERRQQRELALRTAEVIRDFDTQRRGDLTRIEAAFGQVEGRTGAQVQQQQRILDNLLMRVSQQP